MRLQSATPLVSIAGLSKDTGTLIDDLNRLFIARIEPPLVAYSRSLGNQNGLDMCQAIVNARSTAFNNTLLHVSDGANQQNVAYIILDPGHSDSDNNGDLLDGVNADNDLKYQTSNTAATIDYDDYVSPVYFDALWDQLGCVHAESPAGHAHPNVASAASIMLQSITDYKVQLEFAKDIADANVVVGAATVLAGAASIGVGVGPPLTGTALSIVSFGAMAPSIALAATGVAAAAITTAIAIATTVEAADNLAIAKQHVTTAGNLITDATTKNATIYQHVVEADAAGL